MARSERGYGTRRSPEISFKPTLGTSISFFVLVLLLPLALTVPVRAQCSNFHIEPPPSAVPYPNAKDPAVKAAEEGSGLKNHGKPAVAVDVNLVLVNATVTDDWYRIVTGLEKENFSVVEDTAVQEVRYFSSED